MRGPWMRRRPRNGSWARTTAAAWHWPHERARPSHPHHLNLGGPYISCSAACLAFGIEESDVRTRTPTVNCTEEGPPASSVTSSCHITVTYLFHFTAPFLLRGCYVAVTRLEEEERTDGQHAARVHDPHVVRRERAEDPRERDEHLRPRNSHVTGE